MTREEAIEILKEDGCGHCTWQSTNPYECENKECEVKEALKMAISALEHICDNDCEHCTWITCPIDERHIKFDYVPIRQTKGISCSECKYFKITQEPLRGTGGLIDLGQAKCEKHDLITDFAHKGKFKHLKPCEYFEDFKERTKK